MTDEPMPSGGADARRPGSPRDAAGGATGHAPEPGPGDQLAALRLSDDETIVLAKVADILRKVRFGTVVLVVQDGKVVQIEMAEKFRLR
jgi:hypothetical protein